MKYEPSRALAVARGVRVLVGLLLLIAPSGAEAQKSADSAPPQSTGECSEAVGAVELLVADPLCM
jgi:hypothetical protein